MRQHPFDPADDGRQASGAFAIEHADVDDVRLRRDPDELAVGARAVARDDPRDMRPVTTRIGSAARVSEVDRGDDSVREVGIRRHTRVEYGDGHTATANAFGPQRARADDDGVDSRIAGRRGQRCG